MIPSNDMNIKIHGVEAVLGTIEDLETGSFSNALTVHIVSEIITSEQIEQRGVTG